MSNPERLREMAGHDRMAGWIWGQEAVAWAAAEIDDLRRRLEEAEAKFKDAEERRQMLVLDNAILQKENREVLAKAGTASPPPPAAGDARATDERREELGRIVRMAWVKCAWDHPEPKPHWLIPWDELDDWNREVDRCIGEAIAEFLGVDRLAWENEKLLTTIGRMAERHDRLLREHGALAQDAGGVGDGRIHESHREIHEGGPA